MPTFDLIASLRLIASGSNSVFSTTAEFIHKALARGDTKLLNDVLGQATLCKDESVLLALDGLLNMLCTEPLRQTYGLERQWRSYALTVLLRHPVGLVVSKLSGVEHLEHELATALNVTPDRVRCDPLAIPTWVAYNEGPVEAYKQCEASKAWAEGLLKSDPRQGAVNCLVEVSTVQQVSERILLVNIFCDVDEGPEILDKLQMAAMGQIALMLEAPMAQGPAIPVKTMLVEAGSPWTHFNETLHTVDVYRMGGALRLVAHAKQLQVSELSLIAAYVEEDEDDRHTLRVSVIHRGTGELLAGMLFYDLHEPEHFLIRADELLAQLRSAPVQRLEPTYYEAELAKDGDSFPRFFVPGAGWQQPPELV